MDDNKRKRAISGSKTAEFQSLPPGSFPRYLDPKLLITLSFSPSGVLVAGEFTVYKRDRYDALSAHPAKNLILFSHLEGQGTYTNLPRSGALVHYQFRVVSSNIPSLIVTSQFCSILPGGTATGSASDSARTQGSPKS